MAEERTAVRRKRSNYLTGIAVLIIAVLVCYANALSAGFVWDDYNTVVNNQRLEAPEGIGEIFLNPTGAYFRPLSYLTLKWDRLIWQKQAAGFHATNILFHLIVSLLVLSLGRIVGVSFPAALCGALLFAVHPVHAEAVTFISGRSDPLAVLFLLASFLAFMRRLAAENPRPWLYVASNGFFLAAILSRESALIFPLLLVSFLRLVSRLSWKDILKETRAMFFIAAMFIVFRQLFVSGVFPLAVSFSGLSSAGTRLLAFLRLLFMPLSLHMQHEMTDFPLLSLFPLWGTLLLSAGIMVFLWLRLRTPRQRFCLLWFLLGIVPFLGVLETSAPIAEHWLYLPSIGLFILLGEVIAMNWKKTLAVVFITGVVVLSGITIRQNTFWQDDVTLYSYTLRFRPQDAKLHYNLGNAYLRRDRFDQAAAAYSQALQRDPDYAAALNNLGIVHERQGDSLEAIRLYNLAALLEEAADVSRGNLARFGATQEAYAQTATAKTAFDHSLFGQVLDRYLKNGLVDYSGLKAEPQLLLKYLNQLAVFNPQGLAGLSRDEQMAFYINAYNAFTIKAIIDHYPVKSIRDIPGVWKKLTFILVGQEYTLDYIEHKIIRPRYKDSRVHFSLVCAARGCPELRPEPFTGKDLNRMLEEEGQKYLSDTSRNRLDRKKRILYLSSIFKWFKGDFGDVRAFINRYLPEQDAAYIQAHKIKIKYQYDWSLNGQ